MVPVARRPIGKGVDSEKCAMKKPEVRGPSPSEKARKSLGQKLNRPQKPPPLPNDLQWPRGPTRSSPNGDSEVLP